MSKQSNNGHDGKLVHTGEIIRNGAVVLAAKNSGSDGIPEAQVILCILPSRGEFVTHWRTVNGGCSGGHYFGAGPGGFVEPGTLRAALEDFEARS